MAVLEPIKASSSCRLPTSINRTPTFRMAWSYSTRWDFCRMTSFFIPSVSGRWLIFSGSPRVTQAAVANVRAAAQPQVTNAASAPSQAAICCPTASCSSGMETYRPEASSIAWITCGAMREPPYRV